MKERANLALSLSERIKSAVARPAGLDAKEVAAILCEIDDIELRRIILAQFMIGACSKGDVNEVVAWAVVMSHMEGRRPDPDVQLEAMHLITAH